MASLSQAQAARHVASFGRSFATLMAAPVLVALFVVLLRVRPEVPAYWYLGLVGALAAGAWFALPKSDFRLFCLYVIGFAAFNGLRTLSDETGYPVSYAYPADLDAALFGAVPSAWLQDRFFDIERVTALDWALVGVYVSYYSAHFLLGGIVWAFRRELLALHVATVLGVLAVGLVGYYLLPTAPPWLAANAGEIPEVARIVKLVQNDLWADAYARGAYVAGTNDVGAMPSLHTALTAVVAIVLWRLNRLAGVLGWAYAGLMGVALVYLGEHYVVDVLAGMAVAAAVWRILSRWLAHKTARSTGPNPS